jgi:hypothetical protein
MQIYESMRKEINSLKMQIIRDKKKIRDVQELITEKIDRGIELWEYTFNELDDELKNRFSSLKERSETMYPDEVKSHRPRIGLLVVWMKKIIRTLTYPYSHWVKDKQQIIDKQREFNKEMIPFLLATILGLRNLRDRLENLEKTNHEILKNHKRIQAQWKKIKTRLDQDERDDEIS